MVKLCIKDIDDIDSKTIQNRTPLIFAVMNSRPKIVKFLLKKGANPLICGNVSHFLLMF